MSHLCTIIAQDSAQTMKSVLTQHPVSVINEANNALLFLAFTASWMSVNAFVSEV